jgi:hypothetical protein
MIATGKVIDNQNQIIVGATIIESDINGNFKTPISKVIETDPNGIFTGDFKDNSYYTVSYVGTKKFTFSTFQPFGGSINIIPTVIKLQSDNTLPEINILSKRTYYWLIPIGLLLIIAYKQNKL